MMQEWIFFAFHLVSYVKLLNKWAWSTSKSKLSLTCNLNLNLFDQALLFQKLHVQNRLKSYIDITEWKWEQEKKIETIPRFIDKEYTDVCHRFF